MSTLPRGIAAAVLLVAAVLGGASAAPAQQQLYNLPSLSTEPIPNAFTGYRLQDAAVVVVVPDANVDVNHVWTKEPVRFRFVEVRTPDQILARHYYAELRRTLGRRPAGLEKQSLQELMDSLGRTVVGPVGDFAWIKTIVFAMVVGLGTVMFVVALFVLVSAQWRRTRAQTRAGNLAP